MLFGALGLALVLVAAPFAAEAQPAREVPRIGLLQVGSPADASATFPVEIFRNALRDLGYVEGQSIVIEYRWAEGRLDRLPSLAADLVRVKVDVIVTEGVAAVRAAKQATATIPIVMSATDPVGAGLIASLARPGGNVTGSATLLSELGAKRLELLKEALPTASRVAVLYDPTTSPSVLREVQDAAERVKVHLHVLEARAPADLESAFKEMRKGHATAVAVLASPFFNSQRVQIARLAMEHRLPASVPHRAYAEAGGLMSYGPNLRDLQRRAAVYVNKILRGAKPADLPVEQAETFELVINLKTARALRLTIPPSLLQRADDVIQ